MYRAKFLTPLFVVAAIIVASSTMHAAPQPRGQCELVIYAEPGMKGLTAPTSEDQPRLADSGWENAIASIEIKAGTWEFFADVNYAGSTMRLSPGSYGKLGVDWSKKIGSFRCISPASAVVPPNAKVLSMTVAPGVATTIARHWAASKECQTQRVTIKITAPPANGTVTTSSERFVVPTSATLGGPQPCAGQSVQGVVVHYQPGPGFSGQDSFRYLRINEDNAADRLNGEIAYTISVR
jgi:hypothetical protein